MENSAHSAGLRAPRRQASRRRLAVVDGELRFTYAQFRERCDRWAAGLAGSSVGQGDRVATISPNTHQHLEQFYAIPQRGAVIVPMNYRLTAEDFVYMATHSGAKVMCVHPGLSSNLIDACRALPTAYRRVISSCP